VRFATLAVRARLAPSGRGRRRRRSCRSTAAAGAIVAAAARRMHDVLGQHRVVREVVRELEADERLDGLEPCT
jgi:hypothetical protein